MGRSSAAPSESGWSPALSGGCARWEIPGRTSCRPLPPRDDAASIARSIARTVSVVGADHVGLGSDFDGAVPTPFDVAGMAPLTAALLDEGLDEAVIAAVMGGSAIRLLREALPAV